MTVSIKQWLCDLPASGLALPLLSFPSAQLVGANVYEFTHDAVLQAKGILEVARRTDAAAAVCMMDLSVEAEAFGCTIKSEADEVPTVTGILVSDEEEAKALSVPAVGAARTGLYIDAARLAKEKLHEAGMDDRPILAGIIGPFSLAGRLMDVSEALACCIADEDFVYAVLEKTTPFLIEYARAYKATGVDGIVVAEPLAGLLSPALEREFSAPYVKQIIDAVQDENFIVIYHNCGPHTPQMTESLYANGAAAYHFGDAVDLCELLEKMPSDRPVMGNISPTARFAGGTPEEMYRETMALIGRARKYPNFVLSSGCDIPKHASWENIDAFFRAARDARQA